MLGGMGEFVQLKKKGGMGFRNMQIFYRSMLAKQAWRVMNNSETLMARVLKANIP